MVNQRAHFIVPKIWIINTVFVKWRLLNTILDTEGGERLREREMLIFRWWINVTEMECHWIDKKKGKERKQNKTKHNKNPSGGVRWECNKCVNSWRVQNRFRICIPFAVHSFESWKFITFIIHSVLRIWFAHFMFYYFFVVAVPFSTTFMIFKGLRWFAFKHKINNE